MHLSKFPFPSIDGNKRIKRFIRIYKSACYNVMFYNIHNKAQDDLLLLRETVVCVDNKIIITQLNK